MPLYFHLFSLEFKSIPLCLGAARKEAGCETQVVLKQAANSAGVAVSQRSVLSVLERQKSFDPRRKDSIASGRGGWIGSVKDGGIDWH